MSSNSFIRSGATHSSNGSANGAAASTRTPSPNTNLAKPALAKSTAPFSGKTVMLMQIKWNGHEYFLQTDTVKLSRSEAGQLFLEAIRLLSQEALKELYDDAV